MQSSAASSTSRQASLDPAIARAEVLLTHQGPVLLATSGEGSPHVAAVIAKRASCALGVPLKVISVIEPLAAADWFTAIAPVPAITFEDYVPERTQDVRGFLSKTALTMEPYELTVRYGSTVSEVGQMAREIGAGLLVVGAAPHVSGHRLLVGDVAARLLRAVKCSVVSALPPATTQFERVVAAVDFSPASVRAATTAMALMGKSGTLVLLFVRKPNPYLTADETRALATQRAEEVQRLERLRLMIAQLAPTGVEVESVSVVGDPAYSILGYVQEFNAQLVAVGTHGGGFLERLLIGSVADTVLHSAACSVLAAHAPPASEAFVV